MDREIEICALGLEDLDLLLKLRAEVLKSVFNLTEVPAALMQANREYYQEHIADGTHLALVAKIKGEIAGCGAVCLTDEMPSPDNPSGRCGYLMNIYTRPQWRGQGIATAIVQRLLAACRQLNVGKITLETTPEAHSLYARLGFNPFPEILKLN